MARSARITVRTRIHLPHFTVAVGLELSIPQRFLSETALDTSLTEFLATGLCNAADEQRSKDLDYLMIEEDLIAYCTAELQAFCDEEDGGLQEVHRAGAVDACESVLRTDNLMEAAFHDTLMLLATICTNDEVRRTPAMKCRGCSCGLLLSVYATHRAISSGPASISIPPPQPTTTVALISVVLSIDAFSTADSARNIECRLSRGFAPAFTG